MTKFIEATIKSEDAAFYVTVTFTDDSFDHAFGMERRTGVEFEVEHCEGCTEFDELRWCEMSRNRQRLIELAEKEAEDCECV